MCGKGVGMEQECKLESGGEAVAEGRAREDGVTWNQELGVSGTEAGGFWILIIAPIYWADNLGQACVKAFNIYYLHKNFMK